MPLREGLGDFPYEMGMSDELRAERDREEVRFTAQHGSCKLGKWSVSGSRTLHCNYCCLFPPLSRDQVEGLAAILGGPKPAPSSLIVWELSLTCGHTARRTQHRENPPYYHHPVECEHCGGEIMGVIASVNIGTADEGERAEQPETRQRHTPPGPSKAALRRKLREAEAQAKALLLQLAQLDESTAHSKGPHL